MWFERHPVKRNISNHAFHIFCQIKIKWLQRANTEALPPKYTLCFLWLFPILLYNKLFVLLILCQKSVSHVILVSFCILWTYFNLIHHPGVSMMEICNHSFWTELTKKIKIVAGLFLSWVLLYEQPKTCCTGLLL